MKQVHPLKAFRQRQEPHLSQLQLADLLGVTRTTVARWETGAQKVDLKMLPTVSKKTGIARAALRPDLAEALAQPEPAE